MKKSKLTKKDRSDIFLSVLNFLLGVMLLIITIRSFFGDFLLPFSMSKSVINYIFSFLLCFILISLSLFDIFYTLKSKNKDKP